MVDYYKLKEEFINAFQREMDEHCVEKEIKRLPKKSKDYQDYKRYIRVNKRLKKLAGKRSLNTKEINILSEAIDVWEEEARKYIPKLFLWLALRRVKRLRRICEEL